MSDETNEVAIEAIRDVAHKMTFATHKWQPMKTNNQLAKEVKDSKQAKGRAVSARVNLANGFEHELSKVTRVMSRAYHAHVRMTVAWGSNGDRLLPNLQLIPYLTEMQTYSTELEKAKAELLPKLPALIQNAIANNGALGDANDYPSPQDIVDSFAFEFDPEPLSTTDGFAGLPEGFREKFEDNYRSSVSKKLLGGVSDTKEKIEKILIEWLPTLEKDKPKFFQSTIDKLAQLGNTLNLININSDEDLTEFCKHVATATQYNADQLRDNMNARLATAATVKGLLALLRDDEAEDDSATANTPSDYVINTDLDEANAMAEPEPEPEPADPLDDMIASLPGVSIPDPEPEAELEVDEPEDSSDGRNPEDDDDDDINGLANSLLNL